MAGSRHFAPRLLEGIDDFLVVGLLRELGQLELEEEQAKRVFQYAAFGIGWKILLEVQLAHASHHFLRVTNGAEHGGGFFGMEALKIAAPLQVSGAWHFVAAAWNHPATQVLATRS